MKCAGRLLSTKLQRTIIVSGCLSHILNIICKKIMEIQNYKKIFNYCVDIVHQLNHSIYYKDIIQKKYHKSIKINKGTQTRWSSYSKMYEGIIKKQCILLDIKLLQSD